MFDKDGHGQPRDEGDGQLEAVVRVELQFRQQVAAGDAQKCAGAKCQRTAQKSGVGIGEMTGAKIK